MAPGQDNPAVELSADDAYQLIYENVHAPSFFQKLAEHGIVPQTQAESKDLLELGGVLLGKYAQQQDHPGQSKYAFLVKEVQKIPSTQDEDALLKAAGAELAADPTWSRAALTLQQATAQRAAAPAA